MTRLDGDDAAPDLTAQALLASAFEPIERKVCKECGRPVEGYYDARARHMAAAFRSGVPVQGIARAYYVSSEWTLKLITEQLGKEAVLEIQETYWVTEEKESYEKT